jgi:hypothetical protein
MSTRDERQRGNSKNSKTQKKQSPPCNNTDRILCMAADELIEASVTPAAGASWEIFEGEALGFDGQVPEAGFPDEEREEEFSFPTEMKV